MISKPKRFESTVAMAAVALSLVALPAIAAASADAKKEAAPTTTTAAVPAPGAEVGKKAPDFALKDTDGKEHSLSAYLAEGKTVVIEWFNPDCPFVKKHHKTSRSMATAYEKIKGENLVWLAINSGAPGLQGAGKERNALARTEYKMEYPVLIDESGTVGRSYGAKTTPHMFVIGSDGILIYKGAIDSEKSLDKMAEMNYVVDAMARHTVGKAIDDPETVSYGCSVKYAAKETAK